MIIYPIIPIVIMLIICIGLLSLLIKKTKENIINILIIILLFIINLRPMIPNNNATVLNNNLDVLFVIDNTISIIAEDYNGNNTRLSGIQKDCRHIIESLNGARFSIITFDNTSKILIPFTKDSNIANEWIDIIYPINDLYAKGSSLTVPIEDINNTLNNNKNDRIKIIFFISDGEDNKDSNIDDYKSIKKYIKNGAVLGYGTTKGGYMKRTSSYASDNEYIKYFTDTSYDKAISQIDEKNLKTIAKNIGVNYIYMDKTNNIDKKLNEIKKLAHSKLENTDISSYNDIYYIFVILLFILLIIDIIKYRGNELWKRN